MKTTSYERQRRASINPCAFLERWFNSELSKTQRVKERLKSEWHTHALSLPLSLSHFYQLCRHCFLHCNLSSRNCCSSLVDSSEPKKKINLINFPTSAHTGNIKQTRNNAASAFYEQIRCSFKRPKNSERCEKWKKSKFTQSNYHLFT